MIDKKVFIRVRGGLGNQMFQFAFAYLIAKKRNNSKIILDIREYNNYYWPFELDKLKLVNNCILSYNKLKYDAALKRYHFYQGIYRKIHHKSPTVLKKKLIKKGYIFCGQYCEMPKLNNLPNDLYLYGYFQNVDFYNEIRSDLVNIFALKKVSNKVKTYISKIKKNSISINIRFFKQIEIEKKEVYTSNDKEYFLSLVHEVEQKRATNVQLVISSNDVERIKREKWFDGYDDIVFIENCSASEQIEIMKHCSDFILCNSTFSWWIGYLGSYHKDSIVFAPKTWFEGQPIETTKMRFEPMEIR